MDRETVKWVVAAIAIAVLVIAGVLAWNYYGGSEPVNSPEPERSVEETVEVEETHSTPEMIATEETLPDTGGPGR